MNIQWPSFDDDDGPTFEDDDPGDLFQFTPDELHGATQQAPYPHVTKCGIVVPAETDPRRVQFLEQALFDGLSSGPTLCLKDSPLGYFMVVPGNVVSLLLGGAVVLCVVLPGATEQPEVLI
jgi:hypothetical protein